MLRSDLVTLGETVTTGVILISACVTPGFFRFPARTWRYHLLPLLFLSWTLAASATPSLEQCVPIRWTGGPLEIAWRTHTKTLPPDANVRDAIARWYEPATLNLLDGSSINCLLVTWRAPADVATEARQQQLLKSYVEAAHKRGLAVLGLIYAASDVSKIATDSARASLDGLVLEGDFSPEFSAAVRKIAGPMPVIEITKDAAAARWKPAPIIAVEGVAPSGHNLSEMGIRGTPSSQPWIESNIWLARSLTLGAPRSIWISSKLDNPSPIDYDRAVADASAAGAHWIISLDDSLRSKLFARDASALETWRHLCISVKFSESPADWHSLAPYGNVAIVVDPASAHPEQADEYIKLATRRHVPYQLLSRSELNAAALAKFHAIVATELDPPSEAEHKLLQDFAANGGLVLADPSWGNAPEAQPFAEISAGKGTVIVYKDPDPDAVAKDLKELLSDDDLGVVPFNVPSVITTASGGSLGQPLTVQLVNYFDHPVEAITLRLAGKFSSARLETPEAAPADLPVRTEEGRTEITIPKLLLWGAVSMH